MTATSPYGWSLGLGAASPADAARHVARGFSMTAADRLAERLGLGPADLARAAGTSVRTLARRRREGRLDPLASDRLYRLARLFERAVDVFGADASSARADAEADARRWFHLPQWALGGETPLAFALTEPGAREVEALLGRIDAGVLA